MQTNKFFILIMTLFLFMGCSAQKTKSLKVMTWNIWHGGLHGKKINNFEKDTANVINVLKVGQEYLLTVLRHRVIAIGYV